MPLTRVGSVVSSCSLTYTFQIPTSELTSLYFLSAHSQMSDAPSMSPSAVSSRRTIPNKSSAKRKPFCQYHPLECLDRLNGKADEDLLDLFYGHDYLTPEEAAGIRLERLGTEGSKKISWETVAALEQSIERSSCPTCGRVPLGSAPTTRVKNPTVLKPPMRIWTALVDSSAG